MAARDVNVERNVKESCVNVRTSDVQLQSAQCVPSTWAARVWEQISHFFIGVAILSLQDQE